MSIEELLLGIKTALEANTAALIANGGNAAVNSAGAADDKLKKATWFHLVDKKTVVKVEAGG
jgi:hypothetical protein